MGIRWILYRAAYAFRSKSGLLRRRFPAPARRSVSLGDVVGESGLAHPAAYVEHRSSIRGRFFFDPGALPAPALLGDVTGPRGRDRTIQIADDLARGRFLYFSRQSHELGWPTDWLLNPLTGGRHEARTHWCDYETFSPERGDIKEVWEPSRFACAYWLVRAYALTGDEKYPRAFWELFESWCEQNPPNRGPNWKCGQETAIRLFAWCFALHGLWKSPATTPDRVAAMVTSIALQARRIAGNIDYAVSQKNNHGISEAVGLLTVGLVFPELRGADEWRQEGRRIFEQEVLRQVYADGAFVQHSMNYHRVLLHDCLWAIRLADRCGEPIAEEVRRRVAAAAEFLFQMHDPATGHVPNYGPNDGALLLPLDSCDYRDFRPTIQAACYLADRRRVLERGPWDETMLWLFGAGALDGPLAQRSPESKRFDEGGYYTLRNGHSWCMIRCHSYRDRPAHVDPLHLDLWHRGVNVLGDSGTYKYYLAGSPALEHYFKDIAAHNTVEIDGRGPLELFTRFTWLPWPRGRCREYGPGVFAGEHLAYERDPWHVTHRRRVRVLGEGRWEVTDELAGTGRHQATLRWHLLDVPYTFERGAGRLTLEAACGRVGIEIEGPPGLALDIHRGKEEPGKTSGWMSLYYGELLPRPTLEARVDCSLPATIVTRIHLP
ncbi:MAG TPA: alginate lyase family protein [Phycisphaerae bacterium]|nr:alginate lyase family protein [Phycisphaerae bacterium]